MRVIGDKVRIDGQNLEIIERTWWSLDDTVAGARHEPARTTPDRAVDELEELLGSAVASRMESDVPLGAFLSGGIDSSVIAALAQRAGTEPLTTFTVSMPDASSAIPSAAPLIAAGSPVTAIAGGGTSAPFAVGPG